MLIMHSLVNIDALMVIITIDAYLKWSEVHIVPSTSAQTTINKLTDRMIFATHGLTLTLLESREEHIMLE